MKLSLIHQKFDTVVGVWINRTRNYRVEPLDKSGAPTPRIGYQIGRVSRESDKLFSVLADREIALGEGLKPRAEVGQLLVSHESVLEDFYEVSPGSALYSAVQQMFLSCPPMTGISLEQNGGQFGLVSLRGTGQTEGLLNGSELFLRCSITATAVKVGRAVALEFS